MEGPGQRQQARIGGGGGCANMRGVGSDLSPWGAAQWHRGGLVPL